MPRKIAGLTVNNTKDLIGPNMRLCMMLYQAAKFGKTTLAASLDTMTKKFMNKPSLIIAIEAGEGGGSMSVQNLGIDYVQPTSMGNLGTLMSELATDTYYGGIIFDNSTDYVRRFLEPYSLKFTWGGCEKFPTRRIGVPARNDYQTMGSQLRTDFNKLIKLTTSEVPEDCRKHLIVTALVKEKNNDDGALIRKGPSLPGDMMDTATAMFQTVATIDIQGSTIKNPAGQTERIYERYLRTKPKSKEILGDRSGILPERLLLTNSDGTPVSMADIWEKYYLPRFNAAEGETPEGA